MAQIYVKLTVSNPVRANLVSPDQMMSVYEATLDAHVHPSDPSSKFPAEIVERLQLSTRHQTRGLVTGPVLFKILDRETIDEAIVGGDRVVVGGTILSKLDLVVNAGELQPNPKHPHGPVLRV